MKIKKIKKISMNKYKIEFTNGDTLTTYDRVILENNILLKKEIDEELYLKMTKENDYYSVYNKAVKYITTKLRSEVEVYDYLKKYIDDTKKIDDMLNKLKQEGLINDDRYLKAFVEDKVNLSNYGPNKIKKELESMKIDIEKINEILSKYDNNIFEDKLIKIISKKSKINHKDSLYMLKQKIERDLIELGYDREMIQENLDDVSTDESNIIEKEYNKLYKKLSSKYTDNELLYQIKQRLYKKGFSIDKINDIIEHFNI